MALKFILLSAIMAAFATAANAQGHYDHHDFEHHMKVHREIEHHTKQHSHHEEEEHHGHPKYSFSYKVNDHKTGDIKSHEETRDGHLTHGSYSVVDPDGYLRTVKYTVDKKSGFQAKVERTPLKHKN